MCIIWDTWKINLNSNGKCFLFLSTHTGTEVVLKLRLSSTLSDVKLSVYSKDTVGQCKKKLQAQENVEAFSQRWFYAGKLLGDKMQIEEAHIQPGYIVQVIVNTEKSGMIS